MASDNTLDIFSYPIYSKPLSDISPTDNGAVVINTLNAYSYVVAKTDIAFKHALLQSDILVPDGFPVVLAAKLLHKKKIQKIAGADVFFHYCKKYNETNGSCFFMGSSQNTLDKIKQRLNKEFPNLKAGFYSPPFKKEFSKDDNDKIIEAINKVKPDILFVGLTAPKQEKWVCNFHEQVKASYIASIGAVFDFYAGTVERPSQFWISLNLEWFIRLLKEPKRLWKRYLVYSPIFFLDLFKAILTGKK